MSSLSALQGRLGAGASVVRTTLRAVLHDPRAHPREAMVLAVIVALALFIATFAVIALNDAMRARRTLLVSGVRLRRARHGWLVAAPVIIAATLVAFALAPMTTGGSKLCRACHRSQSEELSATRHAGEACYACHASPGVAGALAASSRKIAFLMTDSTRLGTTRVSSQSCMRCHESIAGELIEGSVRVRHAEIIEAGVACSGCHSAVAHAPRGAAAKLMQRPMDECLLCHDSVRASAKCPTCHVSTPFDNARQPSRASVRLGVVCSGGCHPVSDQKRCIDCHGLLLPHPSAFLRKHAQTSYRNPLLCAKCHETASPNAGCACHTDGLIHGSYSLWFPQHSVRAAAQGPGGCLCHNNGGFSKCAYCHDRWPWQ